MDAKPMVEPALRRREPMINAPWTVLVLVVALVGLHGWRVLAHASAVPLALTLSDLAERHWAPLVTYMFIHASWAHVLMNAAFCLVFGAPVARVLGSAARGAGAFYLFFIVCGVLAALGYAALYPRGAWVLVGGSGAASGLMGGAARLLDGRGRPAPLSSRPVIAMTMGWILANALLGLSGLTPGAAGLPVAWQAHIVGYAAGLLLIGPTIRLAGGPREAPPLRA
jgi:membrane associated rhomboid family serine protease